MNFEPLSDKELDEMEIPTLEEVEQIERDYQANKKPQYWVESPFGIGGGVGDTFDFEEALNLAIEYAVDDNEVIQLRKDGETDPCLIIAPAKFGVDMYEVKPISHDEIIEKYS